MDDLPNLERRYIFGARLAGAPVPKPTLLCVSRATVSEVMSAYTYHGKTASAKRNSGQNSTLTERDRRTLRRLVSEIDTTIAAQVTAELNIHSQELVLNNS
jgi:hypothetical protein